MSRIVNFADLQSSATAPDTLFATMGAFNSYANDAAYVSAKGTDAEEGNSYWNTTIQDLKFYGSSGWKRNESELNNATTSDPTANDDVNDGYEVLSNWLNTSSGAKFVCVDATASAAVWQEVSYDSQFDPTTGHDHDGTDSKKVLGTNIDSAAELATKFLRADGAGNASWEVPAAAPAFTAITISADTTIAASGYDLVFLDASSTGFTVNLPSAVGNSGLIHRLETVGANDTYAVIVHSDDNIAGYSDIYLYGNNNSVHVSADGTSWNVIKEPTPQVVELCDEKPSGTEGGGFTSGGWRTRDLNTATGETGIAGLGSNRWQLVPGVYDIEADAPGALVDGHRIALVSDPDGGAVIEKYGTTAFAYPSGIVQTRSFLTKRIVVTSTTVFELQHWCSTTKSTNGFGVVVATSGNEVFAKVKITKVL